MKINVIVVPEKNTFIKDTSHYNEIYINKNIGIPKLKARNAKYVAPLWIDENPQASNRVYHIINTYDTADSTVLVLGNSFVLNEPWNKMGNHRKYEYHLLESFGFIEIKSGILLSYKF